MKDYILRTLKKMDADCQHYLINIKKHIHNNDKLNTIKWPLVKNISKLIR